MNVKGKSKTFYDLIKPYLTNKGALCSNDITLFEDNNFISNDKEVADIFNDYYINIVEYTSGKVPSNVLNSLATISEVDIIIDKIVHTYKDHPSVKRITGMGANITTFSFQQTTEDHVIFLLTVIRLRGGVKFGSN